MKKFFGFRKKKKKEEPPPSPSRSAAEGGGGEEPLRGKERGKLHRAAGGGDLKKLQQLVQKKKHDLNQLDEANRVSEKLIGDGSGNYAENSSSDSRKGLPVFSSPTKGGDTGFTLGAPATNKEEMLQAAGTAGNSGKVVDDLSEDSSRDSRKRDFDSWLTSEDEDFDFSPKKPQKPSLAQLVNVSQLFKKNNNKSEIGSNQLAKVEAGAQNPNPQELTDSNDSYVEEEEEEDCVDEGDENEEDRDEEEEEEFEEEEEESEDDFSQEKEDENIEESWGKLENEEEGFEKLGMRELSETFADNEHVRQQNSGNRNISSGSIGMCHVHREEIPESADVPVSPVVGCYECSDENIAITKVKNQFPSHSVEEENGCKFEGRNMDTHEYKEENTFKVPASAKSEFSSLLNKGRNSNLGNVFESDDDPVSDSELKRHKSRNQNSKNVNFVDYQNITEKQYSDLQELEEVVYEPLHHKSEQKMKENLKADFQSNIIEESSEEDGGGDDDDGDEEDRNVTCYRNSQDQNLVQDSCFTNDTSTLGMDKEVVNKNTESPWDSECTSESTRKPTVDALPTEHIRGVSEEACDGRLSDSQGPEGTKTREKQKTSLMEELGLDEADDIEDESDWDSTSLSLKSIPCAKPLNGFLLEDNAKSNAATKTSAIIPVGAELSDAQTIIPLKGVQGNDQKGIKEIGNDEHKFEEEKRKQKWEQLEAAGKNENVTTEKKMVVNPVEQKIEQKLTLKENQYFILEEEMLEKSHVKNITSSMERRELIPVTSKGKSARTMNGKKKIPRTVDITNDSDDLTQSSDTAAEDIDLPTSVYREAVMLIEQLSLDSKDSASLLKIQNVIHGYEHLIEHEKGHSAQLLRKVKKIKSEKKELQRMLEEMREMKSLLDQQKVEWESDISSLKFSLKQQEEKRISAEMLYEKNQERLKKKEEQYCKEMEEKQQLELMLRSLELELRTLKNHFKEVEQHHIETQRQLTQEQNARALQEGILNTHLWRQKELEEESKRALAKSSEVADNHDQEMDLLHKNHILQDELAVLRSELDHIKVQHQEQETKYLEENEALKEKAEELKKELKLSEEALTQTVFQYSGQINVTKTESALLTSKLEHIKEDKERLEVELHSFRSRLSSTTQELERTSMSKNDLEQTLQRERDEWLRLKDKLTHDLSNLQETNNNMSHLLSKTESKANSLENELHHVTHTLREKNLLIESVQRDLSQAQCQVKGLENAQQMGKDQMNKYVIKQESMQERLAQLQSENLLLRQQLEDFQNQGIIKEKVVSDVQDRFNNIFTKLRSDTEKQVQMVEERNKELITKCNHLRDQVFKYEMEKVEREGALRQLQQELADSLKKQSMSEASLEITTCYRNDLEKDKQQLQKEIDRIKSKLQESEEQYIHSERRIQDLRNAVDAKESEANVLSQKLQDLLASSSGANNAIKQLEEHIQRLEIENARLEATNKQQTSRIEILQKDLQDSTAIHNRFEELITGLQTTKINLEEQLNHQVQKQTMLSVTAQDTHNMWEEELKSRSKLGVRLCELDREKTELKAQLDNEKKKVKKLAELKRSMEIQLDQETKRNSKLQEECNGIKKLLKTTKKKLKEYENGNNCSQIILQEEMKTRYSEIDIEVGKLKRKIDELSHQLEVKSTKCIQLESTNRDLREQLSPVKILHEKLGALEKSKQQLEDEVVNLKHHVQSHMIDSTQREQYKREIEERAGQEIRQKLEEVNWFLQWQELERYKELYSEEMKIRKALESKLDRANEKLSEANVSFLHEHQRTRSMLASSFLNGSLSASPVLETVQSGNLCSNLALNRTPSLGGFMNSSGNALSSKSKVEAYLTKMRRQLETNITRELAQANAELDVASATFSRIGSIDGSSKYIEQDQVSKATQEYLDVLKKNYML